MADKAEYTPAPLGNTDKGVYTTLREVYKRAKKVARKAIFEADDPRKFSVFDMVDNLEDREKRIKGQVGE